ncbi:MAG: hypothetical protein ACRC8Z_14645 [Empedobacter falsenii]
MNKCYFKNLLFLLCLLIFNNCISEEDTIQVEKTEQEKKTFAIFSQPPNLQGKNNKAPIDYVKGFAILMQRYDSIHNTNISGLVNTTNIVEHKKRSHQNIIVESKDFYIENRLHSQTIFEENGDVWVMYPRIKNNSVDGLLIASYTDNGTNVFFSYVKKDSKLYTVNINLFQEKYDKQINRSLNNKANSDLCGYEEVCNIDGPVITPDPGGGGCSNCYTTPPENGGSSGCSQFVECLDNPPDGGGGGTGTLIRTPCKVLSEQFNNSNFKSKIEQLNKSSIFNNKYETGFVENKNGQFSSLSPATSTSNSDGLNISINSETKGFMHTHQNDYETGDYNSDGAPILKQPIRMFSPADVNTLMKIASYQVDGDYSEIYGIMVASNGIYTIKFTGTSADIKTGFDTNNWRDSYKKFMIDERGSLESKFLKFLEEKMNIKGVSLYKTDNKGKSTQKILGTNKKVQSSDCPN